MLLESSLTELLRARTGWDCRSDLPGLTADELLEVGFGLFADGFVDAVAAIPPAADDKFLRFLTGGAAVEVDADAAAGPAQVFCRVLRFLARRSLYLHCRSSDSRTSASTSAESLKTPDRSAGGIEHTDEADDEMSASEPRS